MRLHRSLTALAVAALLVAGCGAREDSVREPSAPVAETSRSDAIVAAKQPYDPSIPRASRGKEKRPSVFDGRADDPRLRDPEHSAVLKGYRDVEPREIVLSEPTWGSAEEAAQAFLDTIYFESWDDAWKLLVPQQEYIDVFWPEFPESRPFTNIPGREAWMFHDARNRDGLREALDLWGGQRLHVGHLEYEIGFTPHTNFELYRGLVIHAVDDDGKDHVIPVVRSLAHADGRWKLFMLDS